ncbi:hypothetical protein ASPZODRAFT_108698 [Penicilliopsis zonata CBS 506.65]|uniref:ML-like domain-containing protein n=1 Tax=Penicilliopsis zonata CBS 506.65 TaxID=1073090 RepID=A0A1L9SX13_9EURO|nr:hypothetical protein ASPZODRAFT_108698 [Penicilliopsis zonata CBS 506.65]OJJ51735.1 hypothetical protein ASPZODRAFT_108698 [Penicilliopsis zonata CBS 506.65]
MMMMMLLLMVLVQPARAALIQFQNCLSQDIVESQPLQLQFVPLDVWASFDFDNPLRPLNITVYGNVSGTADGSAYYPSPDNSSWSNPNDTYGKIPYVYKATNTLTTLDAASGVLTFSPWTDREGFCSALVQGDCPLAPVFYVDQSNLSALPAFSIKRNMLTSYRFSTIWTTLEIKSGDTAVTPLGCISVSVTPDLGGSLRAALTFTPLVILILVGVATVLAGMYTPWGSTDLFRWTSNYGRDEDVLRLVTPGFADCLQYIQFAVLTGALSLNYPGYYQPVVGQAAWSTLMFNQSFLHPDQGRNPVQDGVYALNGSYGLQRLTQVVGMENSNDVWPGMMVWLLALVASVTVFAQLAFALRWLRRELAHIPEEDLRAKNMPFAVGNVIRIVFGYCFLPLISLSFFQLVIAPHSPAYTVALAVVVILILLAFAAWMVRVIAGTRPKAFLFDDLSTVLLYGPLYNTLCDDAAAFALVPLIVNFARGVAIGALQPSGIAQLVLLAICEVVFLLSLVAFRPFPSPTSMNLYHGCFACVRLLTILLSITFVPSLNVSEAARGWIGYVILILHAVALVFGFFLNALQTLIEVIARLAGAGGYEGGATRGGLTKVFGMRQLSRRGTRRRAGVGVGVGARQSMGSEAAMLAHVDDRMSSQFDGSRPRSLSGNSAMLLNRASDARISAAFGDGGRSVSHSRANSSGPYTPTTLGGGGGSTFLLHSTTTGSNSPKSAGGTTVIGMPQPHDPYYRPPRPRRRAADAAGGDEDGGNGGNGGGGGEMSIGHEEGPSISGRATPVPAYLPAPKDDLDYDDPRQSRTDYAVREVDFYYRVRGPPLSQSGTRKLKTGPADPTGPVSSATGWFRSLFNGKTKEKGKGFEVVRSSRAPPPGLMIPPERDAELFNEPYRDDPDDPASHSRQASQTNLPYRDSDGGLHNFDLAEANLTLPQIDVGGGIELPSRMGSSRTSGSQPALRLETPSIPARSSKRGSSVGSIDSENLGTEIAVPSLPDDHHHLGFVSSTSGTGRLPFTADRNRNLSIASTTVSTRSSQNIDRNGSMGSRVERPSSMGFVVHHRAQDNIHEPSPDEPSFTGSAAELVTVPLHPTDSHSL